MDTCRLLIYFGSLNLGLYASWRCRVWRDDGRSCDASVCPTAHDDHDHSAESETIEKEKESRQHHGLSDVRIHHTELKDGTM